MYSSGLGQGNAYHHLINKFCTHQPLLRVLIEYLVFFRAAVLLLNSDVIAQRLRFAFSNSASLIARSARNFSLTSSRHCISSTMGLLSSQYWSSSVAIIVRQRW